MNNRLVIAVAFVLVAAAQIYIPAEMIRGREEVIANGKMFKFSTEPVDPADVMRGRFILLRFRENSVLVIGDSTFINGEDAYIILEQDADGFAKIDRLTKNKPIQPADYLKIKIGNVFLDKDTTSVYIEYPFDRYYMEEYYAPKAEEVYTESLRDTSAITYAVVMILDGEAVLTDVMVNERPISEVVKELNRK